MGFLSKVAKAMPNAAKAATSKGGFGIVGKVLEASNKAKSAPAPTAPTKVRGSGLGSLVGTVMGAGAGAARAATMAAGKVAEEKKKSDLMKRSSPQGVVGRVASAVAKAPVKAFGAFGMKTATAKNPSSKSAVGFKKGGAVAKKTGKGKAMGIATRGGGRALMKGK